MKLVPNLTDISIEPCFARLASGEKPRQLPRWNPDLFAHFQACCPNLRNVSLLGNDVWVKWSGCPKPKQQRPPSFIQLPKIVSANPEVQDETSEVGLEVISIISVLVVFCSRLL